MQSIELEVRTGAPRVHGPDARMLRFAAEASEGGDGLLSVFVPHATAGLVILELGAGLGHRRRRDARPPPAARRPLDPPPRVGGPRRGPRAAAARGPVDHGAGHRRPAGARDLAVDRAARSQRGQRRAPDPPLLPRRLTGRGSRTAEDPAEPKLPGPRGWERRSRLPQGKVIDSTSLSAGREVAVPGDGEDACRCPSGSRRNDERRRRTCRPRAPWAWPWQLLAEGRIPGRRRPAVHLELTSEPRASSPCWQPARRRSPRASVAARRGPTTHRTGPWRAGRRRGW